MTTKSPARLEEMRRAKTQDIPALMRGMGIAAREASRALARATTDVKNRALAEMARELRAQERNLLEANRADVAQAKKDGLDAAFVDRLTLDPKRIEQMAEGLESIVALPDPVGAITGLERRPTGIEVGRMRVPLGVIGIVYESRPNVRSEERRVGKECRL